jgi:gliding motility-associated-like protein
MGDSAIFDAGIGFSIYTWSNGQTSQTITAHNTGMYSIIGTSANGCKSYDTVAVLKIFAMPVVSLNHENSLCFVSTKLLDAGTFSQYLWNTGSTNQTIIVTGIGYYFIEVTDNNGCKATDSNHITTILPLPQKFLPVDSAICTYSTITLKPINIYKSYLWSDNSVSTSISLASSGLYWLQVTDQNNCVGKDSIQISQKNCQVGFYIPNAFTPNNDGKNDVYKPLIFGNVKQYAFSIYNRYGQVVFKTTDLQKGWDGKLSGRAQNGNAFIWICDYQFEDNIKRVKKGSVMLVR